jgi:hypothetical protein
MNNQKTTNISSLIKCFIITPKQGNQIYLTSLTNNLIIREKTFLSSNLEINDFSNNLSSAEDEYEITGAINEIFSRARIISNFFQQGKIEYFIYDSTTNKSSKIIKTGFVSKIHYNKNEFYFKLTPLINKLLNKKINKIYMPICRAEFCDPQCGLSKDHYPKETKCNKTLESCGRFNNVINFRGEPFIPNKIIYPNSH